MSRGRSASPTPRVSVLMPVYEAQEFLAEAVDSILTQTFEDFELLVVDDGSTDASAQIIDEYEDPRIRVVRNERNLGVIRSLNRGLELARGEYIARMDADDVSLPTRLARQIDFLDANPELGACGTWTVTTGDREGTVREFPTRGDDIRCWLLFDSALAHPSVCMRRACFARHRLRFEQTYPHAEDYDLWLRASKLFPLGNLGEVLLRYRLHGSSVTRRYARAQQVSVAKIHREVLGGLCIAPSERELVVHRGAATDGMVEPPLQETESWLLKLLRSNLEHACYPVDALERAVGRRWLQANQRAIKCGRPVVARFLGSPLARHVAPGKRLRLVARAASRVLAAPRTRGRRQGGAP